MNILTLGGRLVRDIEFKDSKNSNYATFSLAVNRKMKDKKGNWTEFFNCVAWGKSADKLEELGYGKGDMLFLRGYISSAEVGEKLYWNVTAEEIITDIRPQKKKTTEPAEEAPAVDGFTEIDDEDLPF